MKRVLLAMAAVLALVLMPWVMPGMARADTAGTMFAVGGGVAYDTTHFAFSAHCDLQVVTDNSCPSMTEPQPTGYAVLNDIGGTSLRVDGPVQCLATLGTSATLLFQVKHSSDPTLVGTYARLVVRDLDGATEDQSQLDQLVYNLQVPHSCFNLIDALPIQSGNIVVQDPVTELVPCPSMTDNTTYLIDASCNLYTNTGTSTNPTWTLMQ